MSPKIIMLKVATLFKSLSSRQIVFHSTLQKVKENDFFFFRNKKSYLAMILYCTNSLPLYLHEFFIVSLI